MLTHPSSTHAGAKGAIGSVIAHHLRESDASVVSLDLPNCDVRDPHSVATAFAKLERLHSVVYAADITREAVVWKLAVEEWDAIHGVNLLGAFLVLREAIPILRRCEGGSIVLIGSISGTRGKGGTRGGAARPVCGTAGCRGNSGVPLIALGTTHHRTGVARRCGATGLGALVGSVITATRRTRCLQRDGPS